MTTGELIVVAIFGGGLVCSLSLLWWLRKLIRQEGEPARATPDAAQDTLQSTAGSTQRPD